MHAGNVSTSKRLQATLAALQTGPKTTGELSGLTGSMAVHSDVAELRANQIPVNCRYAGRTLNGRRVYEYSL